MGCKVLAGECDWTAWGIGIVVGRADTGWWWNVQFGPYSLAFGHYEGEIE